MSDKENFYCSGPAHLTTLDWTNSSHRRSVAASLVQGVYVLESDRDQKRRGSRALAPPWWQTFHFELNEPLKDDARSSIFSGAIFQLSPTEASPAAPRCVVAFRGTTFRKSFIRDFTLDISIIFNRLHQTPCFQMAIKAVRHAVKTFGSDNVWIAGHSLGAAVALLAGKDMAKSGVFIENTFLFNSPFLSLPIERMINSTGRKYVTRAVGTVIKAGLALTMEDRSRFADLAPWQPHLYVNPKDFICAEYVGYFEHGKWMQDMGAGKVARLAAPHSIVGVVLNALGKEWREPLHRIPSAHVTVNCNSSGCFMEDHGICQWWGPDLETKTYPYTLINPLAVF